MIKLLLSYSADPSVVDLTRLNESMRNVFNRDTIGIDSSENENDDESISPLSPLTSDNEYEEHTKQNFHSTLVEKLDRKLFQRSKFSKIQREVLKDKQFIVII